MFSGKDVSVVIPTHNRSESLIRAAESVDSQSISIGEIVVINDGSNQSYTEAREFLNELSIDTKYIETDGNGAPAARNLGADYANGDVLMFLDDDDYWHTKKAERQLELLTEKVGLVYSGRTVVNKTGTELYQINAGKTGDLSKEILLNNILGTTSGPAIRTDLFQSVGGFDEQMSGLQDWELWIRLCQQTLVDYDPAHTVYWTYWGKDKNQITSEADRHMPAIKHIRHKHRDKIDDLGWIEYRTLQSNHNQVIAKKHSVSGSFKKYPYVLRSLFYRPSIAAAVRLLPNSTVVKVRKWLNS